MRVFTVLCSGRKIACVRPVNVGYSWSWGPLLHPRVAVKCQLEFDEFFYDEGNWGEVLAVLETERVTAECMGSPCNLSCSEVRSRCHCMRELMESNEQEKYCRGQKCRCLSEKLMI